MANLVTEFTQADLNGSNQFIFTHNLNKDVTPTYYDENGVQQHTFGVFQVDSANQCTLSLNNTITGTHKLILSYDADTPAVTGVKLFDRPTGSYDNTYNIAIGKSGTPTINVPIQNFADQLATDLDAANKDLSNLNDPTNALVSQLKGRTNTQIIKDLEKKTDIYNFPDGGAALSVSNTKLYTPTSKYHPATLQTVNHVGLNLYHAGTWTMQAAQPLAYKHFEKISVVGITQAVGVVRLTHNIGDILDYDVLVQIQEDEQAPFSATVKKRNDYIEISIFKHNVSGQPFLTDVTFYLQIVGHTPYMS